MSYYSWYPKNMHMPLSQTKQFDLDYKFSNLRFDTTLHKRYTWFWPYNRGNNLLIVKYGAYRKTQMKIYIQRMSRCLTYRLDHRVIVWLLEVYLYNGTKKKNVKHGDYLQNLYSLLDLMACELRWHKSKPTWRGPCTTKVCLPDWGYCAKTVKYNLKTSARFLTQVRCTWTAKDEKRVIRLIIIINR